jgi:hypothetical protein
MKRTKCIQNCLCIHIRILVAFNSVFHNYHNSLPKSKLKRCHILPISSSYATRLKVSVVILRQLKKLIMKLSTVKLFYAKSLKLNSQIVDNAQNN